MNLEDIEIQLADLRGRIKKIEKPFVYINKITKHVKENYQALAASFAYVSLFSYVVYSHNELTLKLKGLSAEHIYDLFKGLT